MHDNLNSEDTQYKVQECILAAQAVQGAIKLHDFPAGLADLLTKLSRLNDRLAVLTASTDTSANAPALSESEPKEVESQPPFFQLLVDSLNETKDRGPVVISREKLQRLIQGFIEFDKCHSEDVEAAYREGLAEGRRIEDLQDYDFDECWNASNAKAKLEGTP